MRKSSLFPRLALALPIAGVIVFFIIFAFYNTLDYYDAFENLINARSFISPGITRCFPNRFYFFSVILSPLAHLEKYYSPDVFFKAAHLLTAIFFATGIFLLYKIYRLFLSSLASLIGCLLFCLNPITLQMAPSAKEDMTSTVFLLATALFTCKYSKHGKQRDWILMTLAGASCLALRYNLAPLLFSLAAAAPFLEKTGRRISSFFVSSLVSFFIFLVGGAVYTMIIQKKPFDLSFDVFVNNIIFLYQANNHRNEPPADNLFFILHSITWPVLSAIVLGIVSTITMKKRAEIIFFLTWLFPPLILQILMVKCTEARYLLPYLPAAYFFAVVGFKKILITAGGLPLTGPPSKKRFIALVLAASIMLLPARQATECLIRYTDPVYFSQFEKKISLAVGKIASGNTIYWCGSPYAIYPKNYLFDVGDEYTYIYHIYEHIVQFYLPLNKVMVLSRTVACIDNPAFSKIPFLIRDASEMPVTGDALLINRETFFTSENIPQQIPPLWIARAHVYDFILKDTPGADHFEYNCKTLSGPLVTLDRQPSGIRLTGLGMPNSPMDIYTTTQGETPRRFELLSLSRDKDTRIRLQAQLDEKLIPSAIQLIVYEIVDSTPFNAKVT